MIQRGEIWWAELPEPIGSEPGYRRPVIIVQADRFNRSRISTMIAVIVTSNTHLAEAPGNVFLPQRSTGLPKDSAANVSQVITVDKRFLTERAGVLPSKLLRKVEEGLHLVMSL